MKKLILFSSLLLALSSCEKIEESVSSLVSDTKEKAEQKAKETVKETINNQLNKLVNAESAQFDEVFPNENNLEIQDFKGKKLALPNGTPFYVFKFKTGDKDLLLKTLTDQPTTDETKSEKDFQKIDGSGIIEKITFLQKFLPENSIDLSFLEDIKNDKNIEFYKVKRFPNSSTVIYNPKDEMVYQLVEVKK